MLKSSTGAASRFANGVTVKVAVVVATADLVTVLENKISFALILERSCTYTALGVTVASKYDAQSAEPCLVGNALATTARRQLSLLQTRVLEAAAATCKPEKMVAKERCIMKPVDNDVFNRTCRSEDRRSCSDQREVV